MTGGPQATGATVPLGAAVGDALRAAGARQLESLAASTTMDDPPVSSSAVWRATVGMQDMYMPSRALTASWQFLLPETGDANKLALDVRTCGGPQLRCTLPPKPPTGAETIRDTSEEPGLRVRTDKAPKPGSVEKTALPRDRL